MRMIFTPQDIDEMSGKFIVQLNLDKPDRTLTQENWSFMHEKRIRFISGYQLIGFYGGLNRQFEDATAFAEYLNNPQEGRFYRLLTSREIQFLCDRMKERQY